MIGLAMTGNDLQPRHDSPWYVKSYLFWASALVVLGLDLTSKALVRASMDPGESWPDAGWSVRLHYVVNQGAFVGLLEEQTTLLIAMAVVGIGAVFIFYRSSSTDSAWTTPAVGMALGGALGNLAERVIRGGVTDFLKLPTTPTFNLADLSIGAAILILLIGYALLTPLDDELMPTAEDERPDPLPGTGGDN